MTAAVLDDTERAARAAVIEHLRFSGYTGKGFAGITRAAFQEQVDLAITRARHDIRGGPDALLNRDAIAAGIDDESLFTGPWQRAAKWASDDLLAWWRDNGRPTYDQYVTDLLRSGHDEMAHADTPDTEDDEETPEMPAATPAAVDAAVAPECEECRWPVGDHDPYCSALTGVMDEEDAEEDVEPEPAPVAAPRRETRPEGARRLDEARAFVARFWVPPHDAALDLFVLWAAGTFCTDQDNRMVHEAYPRVFFGSKGPASGKSTALKMLSLISARGELVSDPTAPALLGLIDQERASLFIDELDTLAGQGGLGRSTRTVLLDGYKQSGTVVRGSSSATGGVKRISCYAPAAMAGMRQNWISNPKLDALRTRTVVIPCEARRTGQQVDTFRERMHGPQARAINAGLARWGRRIAELVADAWPEVPEDMEDRDAELVEPLLAVADAAGADWPERARHAVRVLMRNEPDDDGEDQDPTTPLEMLLADLAVVFADDDRLASRTIVARLSELPGSPWKRYPSPQAAGKEIAAILGGVGVSPRPVWLDGMTVRGYDRAELVTAGMPVVAPVAAEDDVTELPW